MQKRIKNGLDKVQTSIVDIDQSSLFDIFIPKQLRLGKNEIKIRLVNDNTLLKGSEVLIDVLDQFGNPLYYEISNIANEDKTRSLIVSVFEDDQGGKGQLFIYGKLSSTSDYLCKINLEINPRLETEQEIKFDTPPEIFFQEKRIPVQNITSQTRLLFRSGSNLKFSTLSPPIPKQLIPSVFDVERQELKSQVSNGNVTNGIATSSMVQLPEYSNLGIIDSENFTFSSSFKGGQIWIRNLNLEVPSDALTTTPFLNQTYSASIVEVLSTGSIQIYPPFYLLVEYQSRTGLKTKVYDKFINEGNVTCSYFDVLSLSQGSYTQSYAVFDIFDLDPKTGKVDSLDISFKNLSLVGDNYEPLGNFKVKSENILIDKNNLTFDPNKGIVEKQIGELTQGYETYWQTSSLLNLIASNNIPNGILLRDKQIFELKQTYSPQVSKNSEWILSFDYFSEPSQSLDPQLDIYISGSEINNLINESLLLYTPSQSQQLGNYIGSVTEKRGKKELRFNVKQKSKITPKIRPTNGLWSIGNIRLYPNEESGFTAKQTRIFAPLSIPTGSELNFKIEYVNPVGQKTTNFSSLLPGVYFEGSNKPVQGGGSTTIPSGTVSGSDQLTSSFDNRYERKGTGILSSSNQIANEISGAFTSTSSSLAGRIGVFEGKTLFSASQQVIYSQISGIPSSSITGSGRSWNVPFYTPAGELSGSDNFLWSGSSVFLSGSIRINSTDNSYVELVPMAGGISINGKSVGSIMRLYGGSNKILIDQPISLGSATVASTDKVVSRAQTDTSASFSIKIQNNSTQPLFYIRDDGNIGFRKANPNYVIDVSGSGNFDNNLTVSGSLIVNQATGSFSGSFHGMISSSNQVKENLPAGTVSGSEQLTSSYDTRYEVRGSNIVSGSTQVKNLLPTGVASGSEQFTSSYDVRYERQGTGIYSSSGQLGPTGIYSGSGRVPNNTIVSASNLKMITDNIDNFITSLNFNTGYSDVTNELVPGISGSFTIITDVTGSQNRVYLTLNGEQAYTKMGTFSVLNGWHTEYTFGDGGFTMTSHTASTDDHTFIFGPTGVFFGHYGVNPDGIKYIGNYTASLVTNPRSIPDVGTVRFLLTQSLAFFSSSFDTRYERTGTGIVSSSTQVKTLLPAGVASGSEQFTSSYDTRYHKLGSGLISSSAQIGSDISGSFISVSSSLAGRIATFEGKTLVSGSDQLSGSYDLRYERKGTGIFSSSLQVNYDQLTNKPTVSGSSLYRLLISSGSASSSFGHQNLTYDASQSKFSVTGSTNLNGNLYMTGSTSTRMTYIWHGPITVSTTPGIVWTNMPNTVTNWLNSNTGGATTNDSHYIGDFTEITQGRLFTAVTAQAAGATSSLEVQYSLDGGSGWTPIVTLTLGYTIGLKDSGWIRFPAAAQQFCYIRLVGWGGDAVTDPRFSPPIALFR